MRSSTRWLIGGFLGVAILAGLAAWNGTFDTWLGKSPFAGRWKVTLYQGDHDLTPWLLQVSSLAGNPTAETLASLDKSSVRAVHGNAHELHVDLDSGGRVYHLSFYHPGAGAAPKEVRGTVEGGGVRVLAMMERTDWQELDAKKAHETSPATKALQAALESKTEADAENALRKLIEQYPDQPARYRAGVVLTSIASRKGEEEEVRRQADQTVDFARGFGPAVEEMALHTVALEVLGAQKLPALALDYARRAAALLPADGAPGKAVPVLKTLGAALRQAGKEEETKEVDDRVAVLEDALDDEFRQQSVPFKPEPYAARGARGGRVVLVELFTGAQCPPCIAADVAYDALRQTYKPSEVAFLQYHLHVPAPDQLTNPDGIARGEFYGVAGTPALFVDGEEATPVGGYREHAQDRYQGIRRRINDELDKPPSAKLHLTAARNGDALDLEAEFADLPKVGEDIRLRFVLVEDEVRYLGRNGQRLHGQVVRGFPGGFPGITLKEKAGKEKVTVSLAKVADGLRAYLTTFASENKLRLNEPALAMKNLKVIAFIQDDRTKEVWNAAQVDVPAGP